jgi:hypothetical protein
MEDAKHKLVNERILNPTVLNKKIILQHAHDADNMDWRYLSLAAVL